MIRDWIQRVVPSVGQPAASTPAPDLGVALPSDSSSVQGTYQLRSPGLPPVALPADGTPVSIGRLEGNGLRLPFNNVSGQHAQMRVVGGQIQIQDVSRYGTTVNGAALTKGQWYCVEPGSDLSFAGHQVALEPQPQSAPRWNPLQAVRAALSPVARRDQQGAGVAGAVNAAGGAVGGPAAAALAMAQGAIQLSTADGQLFGVKTDAPTTLGRAAGNDIQLGDGQVSGQHAQFQVVDNHLLIMDNRSTNGTLVNGHAIQPARWYTVPEDAHIQVGKQTLSMSRGLPRSPGQAETLPDGRTALVQTLPDGRLQVSKVGFTVAPKDFNPEGYINLDGNFSKVGSAQELKLGQNLLNFEGGKRRQATFLGTDSAGSLRFGHVNEYTPAEYAQYKLEQQHEIDTRLEAARAKSEKRAAGVAQLQAQEFSRVGFSPHEPPAAVASRIIQLDGKLGYEGQSIYPPAVNTEVEKQMRSRLAADPTIGGQGLTNVRLQEWLAGQRGEMVIYRGLKGTYDASDPGRFFTTDVGCALGSYAKETGTPGCVIATRIPRSDFFEYYREVGMVPGRNPYADVLDIPKASLAEYASPQVVISSTQPDNHWMFERMQANSAIQDSDRGREDYWKLCHDISGRSL